VGAPLSAPVTVEVSDARGQPVTGATVEFALTSAGDGAEIAPSTTTTDGEGRAQAHVLLGNKVGLQTGEARVLVDAAVSPRTSFSALAFAQAPANNPPMAGFDPHCDHLACQFTDGSTDSDGSVTAWAWSFGDGGTSNEREPGHSYAEAGTYTVTLSVTDDDGSSDESSTQVTVTASTPPSPNPNQSPQAEFQVNCQELRCTFTDQSNDDDGSIASWQWDFGEGSSSSERNPSHSYGQPGRYQVRLTVRDNNGASDSRTRQAEPQAPSPPPPPPPPENHPPHSEFEVHCSGLTCTFIDRSTDSDGVISAWRWNFGEGGSSIERNPSYTYGSPGRYEVLLTVTDEHGAADTRSHQAEPSAPPPPPANKPPSAEFRVHCDHQTCTFEDDSKDEDGTIVHWDWSFGDGEISNEQNPVHNYANRGKYDVTVTVTDNGGASATKTRRVHTEK
jgi:PKD repeat protein